MQKCLDDVVKIPLKFKFQILSSKADVDYIFHFPLTLDVKYIAFHTYLLTAL